MLDEIPPDISELLEKAFEEKIDNFEIKNRGGNAAGEGYLGEIIYFTVKNKSTGKKWDIVIKQVLKSNGGDIMEFLSNAYFNEIYFYTKVIPSFVEFQKSYPNCKTFDGVAKCWATSMEKGKEKLVFDDLRMANYEIHPKQTPVTDEMYEEIFKLYGRFHGLSMAFKIHQSEKFAELASSFNNNFKTIQEGLMGKAMLYVCGGLQKHLDETGESELSKRFEKYSKNSAKIFLDSLSYHSRFAVIVHGDCWSNNMMFKYNEFKKVESIKLLDFQMVTYGSPVLDLAYSFYSGAAKETLDKLDHFLLIYHNSLRETLEQYDCDVDKIFSLEDLKKEWKENNKFGFLMGLIVLMSKHRDVVEIPSTTEMMERYADAKETKEEEEMIKKQMGNKLNEKFVKMGMALIRHMYENDFL